MRSEIWRRFLNQSIKKFRISIVTQDMTSLESHEPRTRNMVNLSKTFWGRFCTLPIKFQGSGNQHIARFQIQKSPSYLRFDFFTLFIQSVNFQTIQAFKQILILVFRSSSGVFSFLVLGLVCSNLFPLFLSIN